MVRRNGPQKVGTKTFYCDVIVEEFGDFKTILCQFCIALRDGLTGFVPETPRAGQGGAGHFSGSLEIGGRGHGGNGTVGHGRGDLAELLGPIVPCSVDTGYIGGEVLVG